MQTYRNSLSALRSELWSEGCGATPHLQDLISDLADARLPEGVSRLPTSGLFAGPHLEPQQEHASGPDIVSFAQGSAALARSERPDTTR